MSTVETWQETNLDNCPHCGSAKIEKAREKTDNGVDRTWYVFMCYCHDCEQEWVEPYPYDDRDDYE